MFSILFKLTFPPGGKGTTGIGITQIDSTNDEPIYKVLGGADFFLGITLIVVGILAMTNQISSLSPTLQGALIGAGVANTILLLLALALKCKENSSYKGKFLIDIGGPYTDEAIDNYKLL